MTQSLMIQTARFTAPLGRVLISGIFLFSGITKLSSYAGTQGYMEAMGVSGAILPLIIALEILAAIAVMVGFKTRLAALGLAIFCILSALLFHFNFADQAQMINFMKNFAIAGGFLSLVANGAGAFSIDAHSSKIRRFLMPNSNSLIREAMKISAGVAASDGDGVKLTRIIGSREINMVDPLLLFDIFGTDKREDYIGGFPSHPHRGFETVTYLLAGKMRHKDNAGHEGVIEPGGVQWMSAARGIVHSEMSEQEDGLLQGFQVWINLPAAEKVDAPAYQEFSSYQVPIETDSAGNRIKVIAGITDQGTTGPIKNITTAPLYLDVKLAKNAIFGQQIAASYSVIIYMIEGTLLIGKQRSSLGKGYLAIMGDGEQIEVTCEGVNTRFLLIAAKRLNEPVARAGPFVMNTRQEVLEAFDDYNQGKF